MGYQNIDEAARREACEKVKQIAEAIKKIRKKYYLCFNKISNLDKQRYDQLIAQMQSVASENGLEKFNAQLINEIDTQFGENIPNDVNANGRLSNQTEEELYQKFIKGAQLQAECTILFRKTEDSAYLKRGRQIQQHLKKIAQVLETSYGKLKLSCEKARILSRMFTEQTKEAFNQLLGSSYNAANDPLMKAELSQILDLVPNLGQNMPQTQLNKQAEPLGRG